MDDNEFSYSLGNGTYKGLVECGICTNTRFFFFWWIGLTVRPPSDQIEYVFQVSIFLLYDFSSYASFFLIHIHIPSSISNPAF
jgi:hypothetical protein